MLSEQGLGTKSIISPETTGVDLKAEFRALWESLPIALLVSVLTGVIFAAILSMQNPSFETETVVLVDTPGRSEESAERLASQAATYGGVIADDSVHKALENETGMKISTGGLSPNVKISLPSSESTGTLTVSTRADSKEASQSLGDAVVGQLAQRADGVRDWDLRDVRASYDESINSTMQLINTALADNPAADISELNSRLDSLRTEVSELSLNHVTITKIAQTSSDEKSMPNSPLAASVVAAIVGGLLAAAIVTSIKLRSRKKVDRVWMHRINARRNVGVELAVGTPRQLPPITEALVVRAQQHGEQTLVLTGTDRELEWPSTDLHQRWWEDIDLREIDMGVIDVEVGSKEARIVEENLNVLTSLGIPARVAVHTSAKRR